MLVTASAPPTDHPSRPRSWARRRLARLRRSVGTDAVALTFDDGPSDHTAAVLDVLARHQVRASFFVVGRNVRHRPRLVARIVDEGHVIASHSWSHPDPWTLSVPAMYREVRDGRRAVEDVVGQAVTLYRPPHGHLGPLGSVVTRAAGVRTWLWTHDPADWEPDLAADTVVARLRPVRTGDVVVLHDGLEQPVTPSASDRSAMITGLDAFLSEAIPRLRFTTLDDLDTTAAPTGGST